LLCIVFALVCKGLRDFVFEGSDKLFVAGLGIAQAPISSSALSRIVELLLNMLDI